MKLWLDTADSKFIKEILPLGIVTGVTTNPSILCQSGLNPDDTLKQLLDLPIQHLAVQVTVHEVDGMIKQARALHNLDNRIIVKIPSIRAGLQSVAILSKEGVSTLLTAIYNPQQVLLAALAGADYVAPYLNKIRQSGVDEVAVLEEMISTLKASASHTKLMAASIQSVDKMLEYSKRGIHAITVPKRVCEELIAEDPQTNKSLSIFEETWRSHHQHVNTRLFN